MTDTELIPLTSLQEQVASRFTGNEHVCASFFCFFPSFFWIIIETQSHFQLAVKDSSLVVMKSSEELEGQMSGETKNIIKKIKLVQMLHVSLACSHVLVTGKRLEAATQYFFSGQFHRHAEGQFAHFFDS